MSTKKIIAEQVLFRLAGGYPDTAFQIDERDVWKALEQKLNSLFKLKHFDTTLPSGETLPENTMIATYEGENGVAVTSLGNGKSKAVLPINPISLPKNMGIYLVYDPAHPENPFIPLQRGQLSLLRADQLLNDLNGQIGYEPRNTDIIFTKDLTMFGINEVTMELCVFEISQYGVTDRLPVPSDYEDTLVNELVSDFAPVTPETATVNNFTTAKQRSE
jgi:hypothetical protein